MFAIHVIKWSPTVGLKNPHTVSGTKGPCNFVLTENIYVYNKLHFNQLPGMLQRL